MMYKVARTSYQQQSSNANNIERNQQFVVQHPNQLRVNTDRVNVSQVYLPVSILHLD